MNTIPVLFDTDIGNDIDDAVALAYLLREPRCELLGVTTVTGDTGKRAALAEAVCHAGGRTDVRVLAGLSVPLLHGRGQTEVAQYTVLEGTNHRTDFGSPSEAVLFLRDTIRARPHEVTLLATGAMTNIAALFALDPEIPALIKRVVLMCGVFQGGAHSHGPGAREWNALLDPIATAIVFRYVAPGTLLSVGLDVTEQCVLPKDECRARFTQAGGALAFVLRMAEVWFTHVPKITFHDPLAATVIFDPTLTVNERGNVSVWTNDDALYGLTRWQGDLNGQHEIAVSVDAGRFFERYFAVTGGAATPQVAPYTDQEQR